MVMSEILDKLGECVEAGKVNAAAAFPPHLKGQPGADELCRDALAAGAPPEDILNKALIPAMGRIGDKFSRGDAFVPEMLLAARAMSAALVHLRPFFNSGQVKRKGTVVIGTVTGDLHDIGKNLVAMMIEGAGFEVVDLGVDVKIEKLLAALDKHPTSILGLSALLTTTMVNMEKMVASVKERFPDKVILIGGAPVTREFCQRIGASHYSPDPQGAVQYLTQLVA
jgi:methanogenic corrinoid protein MtbC1